MCCSCIVERSAVNDLVIQRLFILKDTIEDEYLDKKTIVADETPKKEEEDTTIEDFLN